MKADDVADIIQLVQLATGLAMDVYPAMEAMIARLKSGEDASVDELRDVVMAVRERSARIQRAVE